MTTHYGQFRLRDAGIIPRIVARWPFAAIIANGADWPVVAHAPLTMGKAATGLGAVEFHLARSNPALPHLGHGTPVTVVVQGPSAHVSPAWYIGRFPDADADRSRTAPTWDYLTLTLRGRLAALSDEELTRQLGDLVAQHEGAAGWQLSEIDAGFFGGLRAHILGYRLEIEAFDCVAKFSQEQREADAAGVVAGLRARGSGQDHAVAELVENLKDLTD